MNNNFWWKSQRGHGPVIATAIHDGHALRDEVAQAMVLPDDARLREEDPFTGAAVSGAATHIIVNRSRFEVDLNRARDAAVYTSPDMSWGLDVWGAAPAPDLVARSLEMHDAYYTNLGNLLDEIQRHHPRFCLLDVHSYNHRRGGADAAPADQEKAPDINIGTSSMPRDEWAWLVDPLMEEMAAFDFAGQRLDVRENVAFQGKGEQTRFAHGRYPGKACAIAVEFKKIYMDEWTGEPIPEKVAAMRKLISHIANVAEKLIESKS